MLFLLCSCSDPTTFTVKGEIDGGGTQNMRAIYYADGTTNLLVIPVSDGKFKVEGNLTQPTMIEFFSANKKLLGRGYVEPGDELECKFYKDDLYKAEITGNEVSERWTKFLKDNSKALSSNNTDKINGLIKKYINNNKDDILSTLLLLTEYSTPDNEMEAAKLLSSINPEARPQILIESYEALLDRYTNVKANEKLSMISYYSSTDSLKTIIPYSTSYSVVAFSNNETRNNGEIADTMRSLRDKYHTRRLQVVDISLDTDTLEWKKSIKSDSATWQQGWVVGAVSAHSIDRLGITRLPFYIVADSTGKQLYRGTSLSKVTDEVNEVLKNKMIKK